MSVSNIVSSFSSTAFFKAVREKVPYGHIPPNALLSGLGIGMGLWVIDEIRKINDENQSNNPEVKNLIASRVTLLRKTWYASAALAYCGLAVPHLGFVIATAVSLGLSLAVLVSIREKAWNSAHKFFDDNMHQKLLDAINYSACPYLLSAATATICTLVIAASHGVLGQKS